MLLCVFSRVFAQSDTLINSGALLEKGVALFEESKYKEAITVFRQISRNDTNYNKALYELSYSYCNDSNYDAAITYAREGMRLFPAQADEWYGLLANAYDYMGKKQQAIAYYDTIIAKNPNNYGAWFNKGITCYREKDYATANKCFQQTLTIYPFYTSAHFFLGAIAFNEGKLPQSMMALTTCLFMNPEGKYAKKSVQLLNAIAHVTDEVTGLVQKASGTNAFEEQQEIVVSKIALDKGYKLQSNVEDAITRQLQVLLEKVSYDADQPDFFMQFYVPFYQKIFEQKQFDLLVHYIFSGLEIKMVDDYNRKNKKDLSAFVEEAATHYNKLKETQVLNYRQQQQSPSVYYFRNSAVAGKGTWKLVNKQFYLNGPWTFYYPNGAVKSKGNHSDDGEQQGEWVYYYNTGMLKEKAGFVNGKLEGKDMEWFDNGAVSVDAVYKGGKLNGERRMYYYSGGLKSIEHFTDDKAEGETITYYVNGLPEYKYQLKNGMKDGLFTGYHDNGVVELTVSYAADKATGAYKKFTSRGVLIKEGMYVDDKQTGTWKTYYDDGKLNEVYNYTNGELSGAYVEYYADGMVKQKQTYVKGYVDGKEENFTEEGWMYSEALYDKEVLKQVKYFNKEGKVISESQAKGSSSMFTFLDEDGIKIAESYLDRKGNREGKHTVYYASGNVKSVAGYSHNDLEGEMVAYHSNKALSEKMNYSEGALDGLYTSFNRSGNPLYKGWYVSGSREGEHISYGMQGDTASSSSYKEGIRHGYTVFYYGRGVKDYEQLYENGWLKHVTQWDTLGKVVLDVPFSVEGNATVNFKHNNGRDHVKCNYAHYELQGKQETLYFDGTTQVVRYFNKGLYDSVYKSYYYGGRLHEEGAYKNNEKEGVWKEYYENGQVWEIESYKEGSQYGTSVNYNEDGTLDKEIMYKDGMLDSAYTIYGENNKRAVVFYYKRDVLKSYSYEGKDGKLVAPIALKNGTGKVMAYYANGSKSAEIEFEDGAVNGIRKLYYSNGNVYIDQKREAGIDEGLKLVYYSNGKLETERNFVHDHQHGICKSYYPNGKIHTEENWYDQQLHGVSTWYDETGKLKQTRVYYRGILQSVR